VRLDARLPTLVHPLGSHFPTIVQLLNDISKLSFFSLLLPAHAARFLFFENALHTYKQPIDHNKLIRRHTCKLTAIIINRRSGKRSRGLEATVRQKTKSQNWLNSANRRKTLLERDRRVVCAAQIDMQCELPETRMSHIRPPADSFRETLSDSLTSSRARWSRKKNGRTDLPSDNNRKQP